MKKRLRKKRRLGEFREYCFDIHGVMKPGSSDLNFLYAFIEEIERMSLLLGGGFRLDAECLDETGKPSMTFDMTIAGPGRKSPTEEDTVNIRQWCLNRPEVERCTTSELKDAWH